MGQFDYLFENDSKNAEVAALSKAMASSMNSAIVPLERALRATEKMMSEQVKKDRGPTLMLEAVTGAMQAAQEAIKGLIEALPKAMAAAIPEPIDYSESISAVLAEVRAIPQPKDVVIPKPQKVDLSPVLNAIKSIDVRPNVVIPPTAERKTHWTFDIVRNRTTGLIETIEAR